MKFQPIKAKINTFFSILNLGKKNNKKSQQKKPPKHALTKENQTSENHEKNHKKSQRIKIIYKFFLLIFNDLQK